jgi:uncharacterized membrane protein YbhN (UPF0104 family)
MRKRAGSVLPGLLVRLAVALGLLVVAFRIAVGGEAGALARLRGSFVAPTAETLGWLSLAWAILGAGFVAGAARFRTLLGGAGIPVAFGALLRAYLVGAFFMLILPGGVASDAWRIWDVRRDTGRGSEALGIVAVERVVSLVALVALALGAVWFVPLAPEHAWARSAVAAGAAAALAASALALHPAGVAVLGGVLVRVPALPERAAQVGTRALQALDVLSRRPRVLAAAFAWSFVTLGATVLAVYVLGMPLGAPVALPWYAAIVPLSSLLEMLPVTIGGAGVREVLYVSLFGAVGMRPEAGLALSLSVFAISLAWGAVGFGLFLARRRGSG